MVWGTFGESLQIWGIHNLRKVGEVGTFSEKGPLWGEKTRVRLLTLSCGNEVSSSFTTSFFRDKSGLLLENWGEEIIFPSGNYRECYRGENYITERTRAEGDSTTYEGVYNTRKKNNGQYTGA